MRDRERLEQWTNRGVQPTLQMTGPSRSLGVQGRAPLLMKLLLCPRLSQTPSIPTDDILFSFPRRVYLPVLSGDQHRARARCRGSQGRKLAQLSPRCWCNCWLPGSPASKATTGLECHAHPRGALSPTDVQGWRPGPIPTLRPRAVWVSGPGAQPGQRSGRVGVKPRVGSKVGLRLGHSQGGSGLWSGVRPGRVPSPRCRGVPSGEGAASGGTLPAPASGGGGPRPGHRWGN